MFQNSPLLSEVPVNVQQEILALFMKLAETNIPGNGW